MRHICISKLTIIGSDNGLSPGRCQVIIWTNAGILLIGTLETNFSEILIEIHTFSFRKMHLKMPSGNCQPFCLGLNMLIVCIPRFEKPMIWNMIKSQNKCELVCQSEWNIFAKFNKHGSIFGVRMPVWRQANTQTNAVLLWIRPKLCKPYSCVEI